MSNGRYVSRKELAERFARSYSWARALAKSLPNYSGRFDVDDARRKLQAGYQPCRKPGTDSR
jgi:hypothetical protein